MSMMTPPAAGFDSDALGRQLAKFGAALEAVASRVERIESDTNDRFERIVADQQNQFSAMSKRMDADRRLTEERAERHRVESDAARRFNWAPIAITVTVLGLIGAAFGTTIVAGQSRNENTVNSLQDQFIKRVESAEYRRGLDDAFMTGQVRMNDREVEWYRRIADDINDLQSATTLTASVPDEVRWLHSEIISLRSITADHAATLRERNARLRSAK